MKSEDIWKYGYLSLLLLDGNLRDVAFWHQMTKQELVVIGTENRFLLLAGFSVVIWVQTSNQSDR